MELYLKKYFWVLNLVVIAVCTALFARTINHVLEARIFLENDPDKARQPIRRPTHLEPPKAPVVKDAEAVASRDVFCSTCEPPKPVATTAGTPGATPVDPNVPQMTSLPLALLATSVAKNDRHSWATIQNTQSNRSGAYGMSDEIPDAGPIVHIAPRFVEFRNKNSGNRLERIDLLGQSAPAPVAAAAPAAAPEEKKKGRGGQFDALLGEMDQGVKKLDDTHYEIDRALLTKILSDPSVIARAARIVPSIKEGKANGFKMYAIRPNSPYSRIGFQNGDTIHSINGFEMTSPDKALEVYTKVRSASNLTITMTRRGQPITMEYSIK